MEKQKLIFGDQDSIAYKKKFEEDKQKELAVIVIANEQEIEREPEYEYDWKCPHCGRTECGITKDELPNDKLIKCYQCGKWLKLKI